VFVCAHAVARGAVVATHPVTVLLSASVIETVKETVAVGDEDVVAPTAPNESREPITWNVHVPDVVEVHSCAA
jgi:hypothetical protein